MAERLWEVDFSSNRGLVNGGTQGRGGQRDRGGKRGASSSNQGSILIKAGWNLPKLLSSALFCSLSQNRMAARCLLHQGKDCVICSHISQTTGMASPEGWCNQGFTWIGFVELWGWEEPLLWTRLPEWKKPNGRRNGGCAGPSRSLARSLAGGFFGLGAASITTADLFISEEIRRTLCCCTVALLLINRRG